MTLSPTHAARAVAKSGARALSIVASAALIFGLAPTAAFAQTTEGRHVISETPLESTMTIEEVADAFSLSPMYLVQTDDGFQLMEVDNAAGASDLAPASALPPSFDLRDADLDGDGVHENYVTRVKQQGAFGTCWAFGSTAAAEASLVAEQGLGVPVGTINDNLDLSEHHLAWFTYQPLPDDAALSKAYHQAGEGLTAVPTGASIETLPGFDNGYVMNPGGGISYATTMYSGLMGPTLERQFPYFNTNDELLQLPGLDPSFAVASPTGDWSLPSEARFATSYAELEQSFYLPSPARYVATDDPNVMTYQYNEAGTNAIKEQLVNGRAVAITYYADNARSNDAARFINVDHFAHYTNVFHKENAQDPALNAITPDHAVCIVGYDDTYPKENFLEGKQPPADGAFIVKNSWGALDNPTPNKNEWGLNGSGYFYLSYYDKSLESPEAFDFVTAADDDLQYGKDPYYQVGRYLYDFLPSKSSATNNYRENVVSQGNIFEVLGPAAIRTLSTKTDSYNTTVRYDLYRLNADAATPTDGELVWTREATYDTGGYHRIELDEPILVSEDGERFGVVVTSQLPDGSYQTMNHTANSKTLADVLATVNSKVPYGNAVVNEGESFIGVASTTRTYDDGTEAYAGYRWEDLSDIIADRQVADEAELDRRGVPDAIDGFQKAQRDLIDVQARIEDGELSADDPDVQARLAEIQSELQAAMGTIGAFMGTLSEEAMTSNYVLQTVDNNPIGLTAEPMWDDVYRLYNSSDGSHHFTTDAREVAALVNLGWQAEGVGWHAADALISDTPIYRLYNETTGEHLFTTSTVERDRLADAGWIPEGETGCSYDRGGENAEPVYRMYNPNITNAPNHLYTTDAREVAYNRTLGWIDEGTYFHGLRIG